MQVNDSVSFQPSIASLSCPFSSECSYGSSLVPKMLPYLHQRKTQYILTRPVGCILPVIIIEFDSTSPDLVRPSAFHQICITCFQEFLLKIFILGKLSYIRLMNTTSYSEPNSIQRSSYTFLASERNCSISVESHNNSPPGLSQSNATSCLSIRNSILSFSSSEIHRLFDSY